MGKVTNNIFTRDKKPLVYYMDGNKMGACPTDKRGSSKSPRKDSILELRSKNAKGCATPMFTPTLPAFTSRTNCRAFLPLSAIIHAEWPRFVLVLIHKGMGLAYAVSDRGACHLRSSQRSSKKLFRMGLDQKQDLYLN